MLARSVDEASSRLRELRHAEWEDLALAGAALGFALAATGLYPPLAMPLFIGGLAVGALGVRAMWQRWDLVERLSGEPDAYRIREVRARAARETRMDRRRWYAARFRVTVEQLSLRGVEGGAMAELSALASELEDEDRALDPATAVACARLAADLETAAMLNPAFRPEELRSRVVRIRSGLGGS